jgi:chemotaxis protein methyltransferase CheR
VAGADDEFKAIIGKVKCETNFEIEQYRDSYIKRRLSVRMRVTDSKSYSDYLSFLESNPDECRMMVEELSINVTRFFRDYTAWEFLRENILTEIIKRKRDMGQGQISVWSAGCSYGEEAYTASMLFHDLLGDDLQGFRLTIHATDFDQGALDIAREAVFDDTHFTETPQRFMDEYLVPAGEKFGVRDDIKSCVSFKREDLIGGWKPKNLDIVFCRNVVIYFGDELKKRLYMDYYDCLRPLGYLMIGKTELLTGDARDLFSIVSTKERIYQKPG